MSDSKNYGSHYWLSNYIGNSGKFFANKFEKLVNISNIKIIPDSNIPKGHLNNQEYSVERYIKEHLSDFPIDNWEKERRNWWTTRNGKRPTWDLICKADFAGTLGLVLVEAKAHAGECRSASKATPKENDSTGTIENHNRILACIKEAFGKLDIPYNERYYQVINRISYAWWIAFKLQIPVTLMFLGFINDYHFSDCFSSSQQWIDKIHTILNQLSANKLLIEDSGKWSENQFVIIRSLSTEATELTDK